MLIFDAWTNLYNMAVIDSIIAQFPFVFRFGITLDWVTQGTVPVMWVKRL